MPDISSDIYTLISFDFGLKYIGVAVGQSISRTASPLTSIIAKDGIPDWNEIKLHIELWKPKALIVGLPLTMDNNNQLLTFCARRFAGRLREKFSLPIHFVDERLTTWEAKRHTKLQHKKMSSENLQKLNAVSAAIILEQWFNSQSEA